MTTKGRLVILSGPSCVGKSPLEKALTRFYPELRKALQSLVLYNSRAPRPGEMDGVDYHFLSRPQIEALQGNAQYVVMEVRGDIQALDLAELQKLLEKGDVFFEGNPFVGKALLTHPQLKDIPRLSVFMAPISMAEIKYLKAPEQAADLPKLVTDVMRRKLLRRTRKQKGELALPDLENIEKRAGSAYRELGDACHFEWVIPNHDGEDSDNWTAFYYLLGDARRSLEQFAALLRGEQPAGLEKWPEGLL
jgi:guanylate kinase